jgi:hypothetical protein
MPTLADLLTALAKRHEDAGQFNQARLLTAIAKSPEDVAQFNQALHPEAYAVPMDRRPAKIGDPGPGGRMVDLLRMLAVRAEAPPAMRLVDLLTGGGLKAFADATPPPLFLMGEAPNSGKAAAAQAAERGIRAYHGSPASFAPEEGAPLGRFRADKIGTGEGAQAYSYGHYFAEAEPVAKSYRDALKDRVTNPYDHRAMNMDDAWVSAAKMMRDAGYSESDTFKAMKSAYKTASDDQIRYAWSMANPGSMYEVNIKADPASFLDWDAPLNRQTPQVVSAVRDGLKRQGYLGLNDDGPRQLQSALKAWKMSHGGMADTPMESILSGRGGLLGKSSEDVSTNLQRAGVPGVRYLDAGSRGAGEGSRNYVVFPGNEHLIEILRKYGLLPFAVGGAAAAQEQR